MPKGPTRDEILEEIAYLEKEVAESQVKQEYQGVLECLEKVLGHQRQLFGDKSEPVQDTAKRLWENYNFVATSLLQKGDLRTTYELLKRAETLSEGAPLEKALTYNNLACYYRRAGKLSTALTYLERALAIEQKVNGADMAQTHLNLCATLSQLGKHDRALYHAQAALIRMYETLSKVLYESTPASDPGGQSTLSPALLDRISVLCIAYHNLAVEHEYLKDTSQAMNAYKEGLRWAWRFLGENHQICGILKGAIGALQKGKKKQAGMSSLGATNTSTGWPKPAAAMAPTPAPAPAPEPEPAVPEEDEAADDEDDEVDLGPLPEAYPSAPEDRRRSLEPRDFALELLTPRGEPQAPPDAEAGAAEEAEAEAAEAAPATEDAPAGDAAPSETAASPSPEPAVSPTKSDVSVDVSPTEEAPPA
jgi:tetratricopeptide (TPR) repeat protein